MEGKSQCRRLAGHVQGKRGTPAWCSISEAEREGQATVVAAVRGAEMHEGLGRENRGEGVDTIQFTVG